MLIKLEIQKIGVCSKKKQGWQIITVWECKVNEKNKVKTVVNKLLILLYQNRIYLSLLIMHLIV